MRLMRVARARGSGRLVAVAGSLTIDDLERGGTTHWNGVRNYQARNYMREMSAGAPATSPCRKP